jgi:hypothetical protein
LAHVRVPSLDTKLKNLNFQDVFFTFFAAVLRALRG